MQSHFVTMLAAWLLLLAAPALCIPPRLASANTKSDLLSRGSELSGCTIKYPQAPDSVPYWVNISRDAGDPTHYATLAFTQVPASAASGSCRLQYRFPPASPSSGEAVSRWGFDTVDVLEVDTAGNPTGVVIGSTRFLPAATDDGKEKTTQRVEGGGEGCIAAPVVIGSVACSSRLVWFRLQIRGGDGGVSFVQQPPGQGIELAIGNCE